MPVSFRALIFWSGLRWTFNQTSAVRSSSYFAKPILWQKSKCAAIKLIAVAVFMNEDDIGTSFWSPCTALLFKLPFSITIHSPFAWFAASCDLNTNGATTLTRFPCREVQLQVLSDDIQDPDWADGTRERSHETSSVALSALWQDLLLSSQLYPTSSGLFLQYFRGIAGLNFVASPSFLSSLRPMVPLMTELMMSEIGWVYYSLIIIQY